MNSQRFLQCFRWWGTGSRHWTEADHKKHQAMGFDEGRTKVADQLAALAEAEG